MLCRWARARLACALVIVTCSASMRSDAHASAARIAGLGGRADMLDDVMNVFEYPALVVRYQGTALADLGRVLHPEDFSNSGALDFTGRSMGAFAAYPRAESWGVFGVVFGREIAEPAAFDPIPPAGDGVEMFYGRAIARRLDAGARVFLAARGSDVRELATPRRTRSDASLTRGNLGLGWEPSRRVRVDLAGGLGHRAFAVDSVYATGKRSVALRSTGAAPWDLRARIGADLAPDVALHVYGVCAHDDFGSETAVRTGTNDSLASIVQADAPTRRVEFGTALTLEPTDDFTMFFGLAYDRQTRDVRTTVDGAAHTTSPRTLRHAPVLVGGAEMEPWSWLTLRLGAQKAYTVDERDSINADPFSGFAPQHVRERSFPTAFGIGARASVHRLDVDVLFNDRTPFVQGFYASGAPVVPITNISVTYWFGGERRRPSRHR